MPSKITLNSKEKKAIAVEVMKKLQEILSNNFEDSATLSFKIPKLTIEAATKPKIIISTTAGLKMSELVKNCTKEVGWHGFVDRIDDTTFKITDIVVYPQTVAAATVNTDELEYAQWLMQLTTEEVKKMRFQGHSHVNMACSPSPVDIELYNKYLTSLTDDDFYIFFICNKRGDLTAFLYDLKTNTKYTTSDIEIIKETDMSDWYNSVKDNIKEIRTSFLPKTVFVEHDPGIDDIYYAEQQERHAGFNYDNYSQFPDSWPARVKREAAKNSKNNKNTKGAKK